MISIGPSTISDPLVLTGFAIAGWVLWARFQRIQKNGNLLSMAGWLFQFALFTGLLVLCIAH